tara:strand:+ start:30501 stop:30857 length:357 start_codon:yes stop_codon:yes gene_type:complete
MRIIIAGGREFKDYNFLEKKLNELWDKHLELKNPTILCGMATGVDSLSYKWAKSKGFEIKEYPAKWYKYGKAAGPMRNILMAQNADALIAFWDGKSPGTSNMIDEAKKLNLKVKIIRY